MGQRIATCALFLAFLSPALFADILVGPPQPLTASTNVRAHEGNSPAIAANANGYLAVWTSGDNRVMGTRFDANGVRIDSDGLPLADANAFYVGAVASTGAGWDAIAFSLRPGDDPGIYGLHIDDSGKASDPKPIVTNIYYAWSLHLTFNGRNYLATWVVQSLMTQTLSGALLDRDLHLVKGPFDIATRDLDSNVRSSSASPRLSNDVATDGRDFLIAWEQMLVNDLVLVPITGSGEVLPAGVTHSDARVLQPSITMTPSGYAVAWHDGQRIHTAFANGSGTLTTTDPVLVDVGAAVNELVLRSNGRSIDLAYFARQHPGCDEYSPVASTVHLQDLDGSLSPAGAPHVIGSEAIHSVLSLAGTSRSFVATWFARQCDTNGFVAAAAELDSHAGGAQSISDFLTSAQQSAPAAASDGGSAVVLWSEQRASDFPQIYAIAAGANGSGTAITTGATQHANPRIASDGRRYLAVWWDSDGDGTIEGRFVSPDGTPSGASFAIGEGRDPHLDVVWTGIEYVVAWTSAGTVNAARITASGEELSVSVAGDYATTGAIFLAAGSGEAVAAFEATTANAYLVESAVIRSDISIAGTINSAKLGQCLSKDCQFGAKPLGIAWSGHDILAISSIIHHPAYGYDVYATPIAVGGAPLAPAAKHIRQSSSPAFTMTGFLAWTGVDYLLVMPVDESTSAKFWIVRLDPSGAPADPSATLVNVHGELIPSIVPIGPQRFLLVYSDGRVVTRTIDLAPAGPRRRAARKEAGVGFRSADSANVVTAAIAARRK